MKEMNRVLRPRICGGTPEAEGDLEQVTAVVSELRYFFFLPMG
jgi:hypothetical protein